MKAGTPDIFTHRTRTGADRFDEVWDGEVHLGLLPTRTHQDLLGQLGCFLRTTWATMHQGRAYHRIALSPSSNWVQNYRIPDLVLLLPERFAIDRNEYFEGAPSAVVEIHSPGDESYEKLPFYFDLGVPEVWIVHRDTKAPEIYIPGRKRYRRQRPNNGWLKGPTTQVELMHAPPDRLAIRIAGENDTRRELPA